MLETITFKLIWRNWRWLWHAAFHNALWSYHSRKTDDYDIVLF